MVEGVRRPAWAEISQGALAANAASLRRVIQATSLCAVVKANGYGHGAPLATRAAVAAGADALAVAIVDEGIELREAGIDRPILLLAEVPAESLPDALAASLTVTVGSRAGARAVVAAAERLGGRHRVHVKLNTGMHRQGVEPREVDEVVDVLRASAAVDLEGIYTHFPVADGTSDEDRDFTRGQVRALAAVVEHLAARGVRFRIVHAANSAGAIGYPSARLDMARIGLSLYGYLPEPWLAAPLEAAGAHLEPVLTLRARVVAAHRVAAGERPSYGRRRALARTSTIVTVPFGYADGYPRRLFEAGAEVLLRGRRFPLAGVVTMDQLLVDVGDEDVALGEEVVLLGRQGDQFIGADEWAARAGTITWEILCGIGARVPRVVVP